MTECLLRRAKKMLLSPRIWSPVKLYTTRRGSLFRFQSPPLSLNKHSSLLLFWYCEKGTTWSDESLSLFMVFRNVWKTCWWFLIFLGFVLLFQNEDGTKVEYRVWNPFRSKLAAAILGGVDDIWIVSNSLYHFFDVWRSLACLRFECCVLFLQNEETWSSCSLPWGCFWNHCLSCIWPCWTCEWFLLFVLFIGLNLGICVLRSCVFFVDRCGLCCRIFS